MASKKKSSAKTRKKPTKAKGPKFPQMAAEEGSIEEIQEFLESGGGLNATGLLSRTMLVIAADNGRQKLFDFLIARGADVQAQDYRGSTALYYAAEHGLRAFVVSLLKAGADPNLRNAGGQTALHRAALCRRTGKRGELLGAYDSFPKPEKTAVIRAILDAGADANMVEYGGRRPSDLLSPDERDLRQLLDRT